MFQNFNPRKAFFLNASAWLEDSVEKETLVVVPMALNERRNSPSANAAFGKEMVLLFKRATVPTVITFALDTPVGLFGYPFFISQRSRDRSNGLFWRNTNFKPKVVVPNLDNR